MPRRGAIVAAVLLLTALLTGSLASPASAITQAAKPNTTALGLSLQFGSGYGGVSFDSLWDGSMPATLFVDTAKPVHVNAYFASVPRFVAGAPVASNTTLRYRWEWLCGSAAPSPLTSWKTVALPVAPGTTIFNYNMVTSLRVQANLSVPKKAPRVGSCVKGGKFVLEFNEVGSTGSNESMNSPTVANLTGSSQPGKGTLHGSKPKIVLYKVATQSEIAEVRKSGGLGDVSPGAMRYFFTSCAGAEELQGFLLDTLNPAEYGVLRFTTTQTAIRASQASLVGVTVSKAGFRETVAIGAERLTDVTLRVPSNVISKVADCF